MMLAKLWCGSRAHQSTGSFIKRTHPRNDIVNSIMYPVLLLSSFVPTSTSHDDSSLLSSGLKTSARGGKASTSSLLRGRRSGDDSLNSSSALTKSTLRLMFPLPVESCREVRRGSSVVRDGLDSRLHETCLGCDGTPCAAVSTCEPRRDGDEPGEGSGTSMVSVFCRC